MLGVRSVFFHGIGFRHIGSPATMVCGFPPVGGNTITSYLALRFGSFDASWVLMYEYGMRKKSNACLHQPSVWVLSHVCMMATRGARPECAATEGAGTAYTLSPSSRAALSRSPAAMRFTMNEPRANF